METLPGEILFIILLYLDDLSLRSFAMCSSYIYRIAGTDYLWYCKVLPYSKSKPEQLSWRRYYCHLFQLGFDDPIGDKLKLSVEEAYIRAQAQLGEPIIGSEKYQAWYLLLPKAIKRGNSAMIEYLVERTLPEYKTITFCLKKAIATAIRCRDLTLAERLLKRWSSHLSNSRKHPDIVALGEGQYLDFYREKYVSLVGYSDDYSYLRGLVKGGYLEEACKWCSSSIEAVIIIKGILRLHRYDLLPLLDATYSEIIRRTAIQLGRLDIAKEYGNDISLEDTFTALMNLDPEKAKTLCSHDNAGIRPNFTYKAKRLDDARIAYELGINYRLAIRRYTIEELRLLVEENICNVDYLLEIILSCGYYHLVELIPTLIAKGLPRYVYMMNSRSPYYDLLMYVRALLP